MFRMKNKWPLRNGVDDPATSSGGSFAELALDVDLADDLGEPEVEGEVPDEVDEVTPPVETPVQPVVETPPAATHTPAAPTPPAVAPTPVPTPATETPTPPAVATPPETPPDLSKQREEALAAAAAAYQFSEQDARMLMTEPEKVLPRFLAEAQFRAQEVATRVIMANLPAFLERIKTHQDSASRAETAFFAKWPGLKDHGPKVQQQVMAYRQANPDATLEDVIEDVGAIMSRRLKIAPPAAPAAATPPAASRPTPRAPAGAAAAPIPPAKKPEDNAWSDLANFETPDD